MKNQTTNDKAVAKVLALPDSVITSRSEYAALLARVEAYESIRKENCADGVTLRQYISALKSVAAAMELWKAHKFSRPISDHPEAVEQRKIYDAMTQSLASLTAVLGGAK